jgi:hypothetical protein
LLLSRRWWLRWLNLTLRLGRLHLTFLSSLLSWRWGWRLHLLLRRRLGRLHLTLLSSLLSRLWGWRLHLLLLRRRLHLTLLWLWRARPLRRLFLFLLFLICFRRLRNHEHAIEWRGVRRCERHSE